MIVHFRHKGLARLYEGKPVGKGLPAELITRIERLLALLDSAPTVEELIYPGLGLHRLRGDRDEWAIRVNDQFRLTFHFDPAKVEVRDVNFEDYH